MGDEFNPEDHTLINAPGNGASVWTTYEIQKGNFQGFGVGAGLFYVGDVEAEIPMILFYLLMYVLMPVSFTIAIIGEFNLILRIYLTKNTLNHLRILV